MAITLKNCEGKILDGLIKINTFINEVYCAKALHDFLNKIKEKKRRVLNYGIYKRKKLWALRRFKKKYS